MSPQNPALCAVMARWSAVNLKHVYWATGSEAEFVACRDGELSFLAAVLAGNETVVEEASIGMDLDMLHQFAGELVTSAEIEASRLEHDRRRGSSLRRDRRRQCLLEGRRPRNIGTPDVGRLPIGHREVVFPHEGWIGQPGIVSLALY